LTHKNNVGEFSYNTSFNISFNKSEVKKFPNPSIGEKIYAEGHEWGAFYGYEYIGLYQTDEQVATAPKVAGTPVQKGDLMFKDQNDDEKITADDRIDLGGTEVPGITYGINLDIRYKKFDLTLRGQGTADVYQRLANNILFPFYNGYKAQKADLDRWTPENPNAGNPIIHVNQRHNYTTNSSFVTRKSNYFRLKSIQLGYTFDHLFDLDKVRLYVSGQNVLTFMNSQLRDRGFDPESPSSANTVYPNTKIFIAGINVNF
jgi:hypothetical protein